MAYDPGGQLWVADTANDRVVELSGAGAVINTVTGLNDPRAIVRDPLTGGMLVAVAWTFSLPAVYSHTRNLVLIILAVAIGAVIAVPAARLVKMTAMPQMVAIFNGVGGGAAARYQGDGRCGEPTVRLPVQHQPVRRARGPGR